MGKDDLEVDTQALIGFASGIEAGRPNLSNKPFLGIHVTPSGLAQSQSLAGALDASKHDLQAHLTALDRGLRFVSATTSTTPT